MILHSRISRRELAIHRPDGPRGLRVLAVGDVDHAEFAAARECLAAGASLSLVNPHSVASDTCSIDLLIVFQSRPGSFSREWVVEAQQRMPLAGFVALLGSWCEGEQRTGTPLPSCERVFWYQFPAWWRNVLGDWSAGRPVSWQVPGAARRDAPRCMYGLVAIDAIDADCAEALIAACEALGVAAIWRLPHRPRPLTSSQSAGIFVAGQLDDREAERLSAFRSTLAERAPLIALLDFPRRDRVQHAMVLGATAVLGKPWRLEQLAACL